MRLSSVNCTTGFSGCCTEVERIVPVLQVRPGETVFSPFEWRNFLESGRRYLNCEYHFLKVFVTNFSV